MTPTRIHPERTLTRVEITQRYQRKQLRVMRELKETPCVDCGGEFPYWVMDFDHGTNDKAFDIGKRGVGTALSTLEAELAKCEVVCANCHRERTHARRAGE